MYDQRVIMVQIDEPKWTEEVLHSACRLAQQEDGRVVLVQMLRLQHIIHLGSSLAAPPLSAEERRVLQAYVDVAATYDVACDVKMYQYCDLFSAIEEAASEFGATIVFARLPQSRIPFWSSSRFEVLRQHLEHKRQTLYSGAIVVGQ